MRTKPALALALAAPLAAHAITYGGNPNFKVRIADDAGDLTTGSAHLETVRVLGCSGGTYTDYSVDEDIDPIEGWSHPIPAGTYCGVVVFWDGPVLLEGSNAAGTFELSYEEASTTVTFGASSIPEVPMTPMGWLSGEPCGALPDLIVTIE